MGVPASRTGNPKSRQKGQQDDKPVRVIGEGQISGNLCEDPELRYTATGRAVAKLRVAYTPRTKNDETGRWEDGETEFYNCDVWGQQAENCAEHLQRGDRVVAIGEWRERDWETREGEKRTSTEMTVRDVGPSLLFRGANVVRTRRSKDGE
jgi:single-strand DNA-binding protein